MQLSPEHHNRSRFIQATVFLVAIALTLTGIAGLATQAKAGPVSFTISNAQLSAGAFRQAKVIPATPAFPSDSLPLPQRTDIQLNGTETNGAVSFPAATNTGLQFPYMSLQHPLEPGLLIPVTMRLNNPGLTGTYDAATGAATLKGSIDIIVVTGTGTSFPLPDATVDAGVPPLGLFARCRIPDVPVSFSTTDKFPFNGDDFKGGFGVNGSLSTFWLGLPDAVSENGGDCELLPLITSSSGGIWFSNGIVAPEPQPPVPPATCETDPNLCDPDPAVNITAARLTPKKRSVKAGKVIKLKVKVTNRGEAAARKMKITIKSSNRLVKVPKRIRMNVPARSSSTRVIKVRVKAKARGRAKITVNASGKRASANLKIKKARKTPRQR